MPPKPISTKPYADIARAGKPIVQRQAILAEFERQARPLNRRMIAALTRIPINVICWRVKGMIDSDLLEVVGEREDPVTGQFGELLYPTSGKPVQKSFNLRERIDR